MKRNIRNSQYLTSSRLLCAFLCLILTIMCCPLNVYSASETINKKSEAASSESVVIGSPDGQMEYTDLDQMRQMRHGEKTIEELSSMSLDPNDLPELISLDEAIQKGHVYRVREQENNLSSVVFQNKNGKKTVYMFTEPVKYIDSTGLIRDKSTKIQAISDKIFAMADNSVQAYFPRDIGEGISIHYGEHTIQMIPFFEETDNTVLALDESDNTIIYSNVFSSEYISLIYTPLMQGVKEDIVLNRYTGQSVFQFTMLAEGLSAVQENENWILRDVMGKKIASFGKIIVKDSAGHEIIGKLDISTWSEGAFYLTITVSEEFLQSSATTYPVYIDPTAHIWETSYYYDDNDYSYEYDSIIDVGVYNGTSEDASDDNGHHYLGGVEGGRVIYKLPDFYNIVYGQYRNFSDYQIGSVKIKAYFEAGPATMISAYPMSKTWDEDTYGENPILIDDNYDLWSVNSSLTAQNTYIYSSLEGTYDIDITNIVRGWAQFNKGKTTAASKNPSFGLILCSDAARAIRSCENSESISNAYIQMDYSYIAGEYFAYSLDGSYRFLRRNSATSITTNSFSNSDAQKWIFEYIGNDKYYIHSVYDTNNVLYRNGSTVSLSSLPTYPTNEFIWTITNASGGGVIIKSTASPQYVLSINGTTLNLQQLPSTGSDAYQQCRWGILNLDYYVPMTNFKLSDDWIKPGSTKYFNVQPSPENATWYSGSNFDWTISDTSKVSNSSNKLTGVSNGVVNLTGRHKITGMTRSFRIVCGNVREGTYMLSNKGTGRYMDVKGPSKESGAYIHQWDFHTNPQEKWKISMLSNGEYIIQSVYSQKYLRIENGSNASGANMIQFENYSWTSTRWKIEETSSGAYKICSMLTNYAVSVPSNSNSNGTTLVQLPYTNDSNYRDEWLLYKIEFNATLYSYYDMGYPVAYNESESISKTQLELYSEAVAEQYLKLFGLALTVGKAQYYQSPIDICKGTVTSNNLNNLCSHSGTAHSDRNSVISSFKANHIGNNKTTYVLWTGHKIKSIATNGNVNYNRSCSSQTCIFLLEISSSSVRDRDSKGVLMHELNHQYGAKDHYHELANKNDPNSCKFKNICSECGYNPRPSSCIMYQSRINVASNTVICSYCQSDIKYHLTDHHAAS